MKIYLEFFLLILSIILLFLSFVYAFHPYLVLIILISVLFFNIKLLIKKLHIVLKVILVISVIHFILVFIFYFYMMFFVVLLPDISNHFGSSISCGEEFENEISNAVKNNNVSFCEWKSYSPPRSMEYNSGQFNRCDLKINGENSLQIKWESAPGAFPPSFKFNCYAYFAIKNKEISYCDNLYYNSSKESCREKYNEFLN